MKCKKIDYSKYVGQYVKRFYTPFKEENIFKIHGYRIAKAKYELDIDKKGNVVQGEFRKEEDFQYHDGHDSWWSDVDDSVVITNELPMIEDKRLANVNDSRYKGHNPFTKESKIAEEKKRQDNVKSFRMKMDSIVKEGKLEIKL